MATPTSSKYVNLYNFALLTLQGYECIDANTLETGNTTRVVVYMHKKGTLPDEKKIMAFDLMSLDTSISAIEYTKVVSDNFHYYATSEKSGLKPSTKRAMRPYIKTQAPEATEKNLENGSYVFNVEKLFSDVANSKDYNDVSLIVRTKYMIDSFEREMLADKYDIHRHLTQEEKTILTENLRHLSEIVAGKEPSNVAKIDQSMSR